MRPLALVFAALLFATASAAQQSAARRCSSPEFRQFDFWVGEWQVSWPASQASGGEPGKGTNRVQLVLDGCVVVENFDGTPAIPLRGMSVSTFNAHKGKWQQTWVDNSGGYLDFEGEFKDGQMILVREALTPDGKSILQRMVWKNIRPDSFDWSWERSDDGGQTWRVQWPIRYERSRPKPESGSRRQGNTCNPERC